jgi:anti-sigma regulatory factor (Ser/Thr protein kinase)
MTSARQLTAPDSASWSWITAAPGPAPPRGVPGSHPGFPRTAIWPVAGDSGLRSVAVVRAAARATLRHWGITERGDDIVLVLSELLANALLHALPGPGRWDVTAGLLQPGRAARVLCAVADPGPDWRRPRPGRPDRESGRGLRVIAELSLTWGYVPVPAGKVAWALLGDPAG